MSPVHGSKARVYLNGYDVGQYLTSVSPSWDADTAETTTLGKTAKTYTPGLADGTLSMEGIWEGGTGELDEIMAALAMTPGGAAIASYLPEGDAFGSRFWGVSGNLNGYSAESPVDDVSSASVEVQSSNAIELGRILHVLQAEVAGGNTTNLDNTASTPRGGVGFLQVVSGTTLAVKIQHSPDNSVWTDLITFATTSTRGAQRLATAATATVNRHTRVLWTGSGTFAVGFARL